jgi:hypothetical protein
MQLPLHDFLQFLPIVHFLEGQPFYRCSGNDHAVKGLFLDLGKGLVKSQHVLLRRVLGCMIFRMQQHDIHLQSCITNQPQDLGLGHNLGRHQIQDYNFEGPDVLRHGTAFSHNKYIFTAEHLCCRQIIGYFDGHFIPPSFRINRRSLVTHMAH